MKESQNYRGVRLAHLVNIKEGLGTPESPSRLVEYVLVPRKDGALVSYGKVVPLTDEEQNWIGKEEQS